MDNETKPTPAPEQPIADQKTAAKKPASKSTKQKLSILVGAIILVAVIAIGYIVWAMQPANALANGINNLITTREGNFSIKFTHQKGDEAPTEIAAIGAYEGSHLHTKLSSPTDTHFNGDVELKLLDENGVYGKITDTRGLAMSLVNAIFGSFGGDAMSAMFEQALDNEYKPVIDAVEGNWIDLSTDSINDATTEESQSESYQCAQEAFNLLNTNAARNELRKTYDKHNFIVIEEELGVKDGAVGFVVSVDEEIFKEWDKAMEDTEFGKKIASCNKDNTDEGDIDEEDTTSAIEDDLKDAVTNTKVSFWVDRVTHQPRSIESVTKNTQDNTTSTFLIDFTEDFAADFNAPSDALTVSEISDLFVVPEATLPIGE